MRQALELAKKGEGFVEPNPMVGCVLVQDNQIVGQGYHTQYGNAHAEVEAIRSAKTDLTGATCYVTLEPCSHYGKTPPCVQAILQTGIQRVVVAMRDPNPIVNGKGIQILQEAGLSVTEHVLEAEAEWLNAPYLTLLYKNRPWIHAKWAMTLDGRLATKTHESRWISGDESRKIVHQLRSRMDAVVVGAGTARHDDPMLTVRLDESDRCGNKTPCRVVLGDLLPESQLVRTASEVPVLIVTATDDSQKIRSWEESGCEVLQLPRQENFIRLLLEHFASRRWTHVLVEGGRQVFGTFFDAGCIDEVHAFIAPKLIGGESAISVIGGEGLDKMSLAALLESPEVKLVGQDIYVYGRTYRSVSS
jgi:diaminohydroxyphosphoribosylaminopyrimidine deaminase/5-amino-6-(5-phosphoribosylamino)uracil reductase